MSSCYKQMFYSLTVVFGSSLWVTCKESAPSKRVVTVCSTSAPNKTTLTNVVSYNTDVAPILVAKCLECHGSTASPNLATYSAVKSNYARLMQEINSGSMPKGNRTKVTPSEMNILTSWATGGYIQTSQNSSINTTPQSTDLTYDNSIKSLISSKCLTCHEKMSPDLTTYQNVRTQASSIYSAINSARMPKGLPKLPATEIVNFKTWMDNGSPENSNNIQSTPTTPNSNGDATQGPSDNSPGC